MIVRSDVMTDFNQVVLSVLLVLCCVLVIFLIVVAIKLLYTADKVNIILSDIQSKMQSVNGVFTLMDNVTNRFSTFNEILFSRLISLAERIFKKREE
jgi:cell division protein FtsL